MENTARKKAVIYARVSSKEQETEGFSIPAQKSLLNEYAIKKNFNVIRVFQEAETAKKAGRREFEKLVEYLKSNPEVKILLVEKTDRLTRNFLDVAKLDYESLGIEIHFVKENQILSKDSNSNAKFMYGINLVVAKRYVDNLSEEVKKGHAEKLKLGIWPGKAPIGYLNKLDTKTIIKDEKLGPIIAKAFELASSGNYTLRKLKKELFQQGVRGSRSGAELSKSQMSRILSNPFYYGEIDYGGKRYKGIHEPLISKQLFEKAQYGMGFIKKPSSSKHDFVFRGPLTCGHCGSQITAERKTKKSGLTYIYYHCTNGKGTCTNVSYHREGDIEKMYIQALQNIFISEDIVEFTRNALLSSHNDEREFRESQISLLNSQWNKLQNKIDKCYEDKLDGIIASDAWENKTAVWKSEQDDILVRLKALKETNTHFMLEGVKLMEIANSAAKLFPLMTMEEKREVLSLVLSNPRIENANIRYDYKKPFGMFGS